ncbi:MAG TPA: acyltransferase [Rhodocyclaceae bacterium]|nr:acyltransferase [Rhodocyclaceae bacterium]
MCTKGEGRIPSLDGLRAVAISIVLLQHFYSNHSFRLLDFLWRFQLGDLGVRIFFVISGFLITTLLIKEQRKHGAINLPGFYLHRVLRIFPAYYLMLAIMAVAAAMGLQEYSLSSMLAPATYLSNYFGAPMPVAHTWSLAVEEQFYLLWPGVIVLCGWRRGAWVAIALCIGAVILRTVPYIGAPDIPTLWPRFEVSGDAIAMGCLYAMWRAREIRLSSRSNAWGAYAASAALTLILLTTSFKWPMFWNSIGIVAANCLIVLILHAAITAPRTLAFSWLNSGVTVWIGTLSYSLYLWQQVFIYGGFRLPAPLNLIAIFTCALLSYYLVETPFLKLKARRSLPQTVTVVSNSTVPQQVAS